MTYGLALRQYFLDVAVLARKDVMIELRERGTVPAMLLFVLGALVIFHFAVPSDLSNETQRFVSFGLLWVAVIFTAILGLTRVFATEREQRLIEALVLTPCDRSAIWLAKSLAIMFFLLLMELVALPAFVLFFQVIDAWTVGAVLLANVGIAAVGTVFSAVAAASRTRELLLPLLLIPVVIPIIVGGIGVSVADEPMRFLGFLILYDSVFAIISWASFEYVITE